MPKPEFCICPKCGFKAPKTPNIECVKRPCLKCKAPMEPATKKYPAPEK